MDPQLQDQAIKCALDQNWKQAIKLNQQLLDTNKEDIAALNRLAYAYLKSGNIPSAKTTYKKVLKIDKYNPIAVKNLKWLSNLTKNDILQEASTTPSPTIFIEEPGKTKIVTLVNAAPFKVLCNVMTAQKVNLVPKKHSIEIRTAKGVYLGALPDDLSHRLIKLIDGGNTYDAYIKNVQKNVITIFMRELKRSKKYTQIPSFALSNGINSLRSADMDNEDEDAKREIEED